jgi:hypothetical protein
MASSLVIWVNNKNFDTVELAISFLNEVPTDCGDEVPLVWLIWLLNPKANVELRVKVWLLEVCGFPGIGMNLGRLE